MVNAHILNLLYILKGILQIMKKPIDWDKVAEERREKVAWIPQDMIFHAYIVDSQEATRIARMKLPKQYRIRNVHYEYSRASFGFIVMSPEFPSTDPTSELPSLKTDKIEVIKINIEKE